MPGIIQQPEFPPRTDFSKVYRPLPDTASLVDWDKVNAESVAQDVLLQLSTALDSNDLRAIERLLRADGCHWKDSLALTAHLRTFNDRHAVAPALWELNQKRGIHEMTIQSAMPVGLEEAKWISANLTFRTKTPSASCKGIVLIVPESQGGSVAWKIWSMSTWLVDFDTCPESQELLWSPSTALATDGKVNTDVLIIGGGNSGLILAARLKAYGVRFVIVEKNAKAGDNWALRYDCMRFHIYTTTCSPPYLPYPEDSSTFLKRNELAAHMARFAEKLDLNKRVLYGAQPKSTLYDQERQVWESQISCGGNEVHVSAKFLVIATGAGFAGKFIPDIPGADLYKGTMRHSVDYTDAKELVEKGAKSAIVVGTANTGFDIFSNCYEAGLKTTVVQRSETYVMPVTYFQYPMSFGVYEHVPAEMGDAITHCSPLAIGGPLLRRVNAMQSEAEPDRYKAVREAGFQIADSTRGDLMYQLLDRCGGHFVDAGHGIDLIGDKKVDVKSGVTPVAYTADGLKLSDGSVVDADAIVWCTGFGAGDGRGSIASALGKGGEVIANRMEPLWGVDADGDVRGLWKRGRYQDNVWVLAGGTTDHRWYSKVIALQIKGLIEGVLPEPYRETPRQVVEA
ncbi:hypothetical protein F66182_5439 [Fusarium sp. NRRL 66182]|nr:hypothetical protein F66182_5439 [Fusarium sp. NRRL 66182]